MRNIIPGSIVGYHSIITFQKTVILYIYIQVFHALMTLKYVYNYVAKALLLRTVKVQIKPTYYDVIVQITPLRLYSYNHSVNSIQMNGHM